MLVLLSLLAGLGRTRGLVEVEDVASVGGGGGSGGMVDEEEDKDEDEDELGWVDVIGVNIYRCQR